jgi:hypothetical protein
MMRNLYCSSKEAADVGGLMSYGAELTDSYRRVAYFVVMFPPGRAKLSTSPAATGSAVVEKRWRIQFNPDNESILELMRTDASFQFNAVHRR